MTWLSWIQQESLSSRGSFLSTVVHTACQPMPNPFLMGIADVILSVSCSVGTCRKCIWGLCCFCPLTGHITFCREESSHSSSSCLFSRKGFSCFSPTLVDLLGPKLFSDLFLFWFFYLIPSLLPLCVGASGICPARVGYCRDGAL